MVQFYLEGDRITEFVAHLMKQKPVYAPHRKGRSSFSFEKTENAEDVVLDYPRTMHSIRKYFLPPREKLMTFDLTENSFAAIEAPPAEAIFFGVHTYDLGAVQGRESQRG